MSPRKKTRLQRTAKDHPNKANEKKRVARIQNNAQILRELAAADTETPAVEEAAAE